LWILGGWEGGKVIEAAFAGRVQRGGMLEEEIWWLDGALLCDEALSSDACKSFQSIGGRVG